MILKNLKRYLVKNKYLVLFLSILIFFGIIVGLYLGIANINYLKEEVISYTSNIANQSYNYLFFHFFLVVMSIITSFFAIGIPLLCTIIFYEGMSVGFLIGIFTVSYGFPGCLFSLIFIIITKLFYIIALLFLFSKCLGIGRKMIGKYLYKTDPSIIVIHLLKGCACVTVGILIYDILIALFGSKIVALFAFLLK